MWNVPEMNRVKVASENLPFASKIENRLSNLNTFVRCVETACEGRAVGTCSFGYFENLNFSKPLELFHCSKLPHVPRFPTLPYYLFPWENSIVSVI